MLATEPRSFKKARMIGRLLITAAALLASASIAFAQCSETELRAATTPSPPPWPANLARHETLLAAPKKQVDLVVVGDSIAMGWNQQAWAKRSVTMFNLGVGGDRAQNTLWRLASDEWKSLSPKRVIVILGTNNLAPTGSGRSCVVVAALKKVFERIAELWPKAQIGVFEIFPRGKEFAERDSERREVNAELRKIKGITAINGEEIACGFQQPCPNYSPDNLHLSGSGYEFLTDSIQRIWPLPQGR